MNEIPEFQAGEIVGRLVDGRWHLDRDTADRLNAIAHGAAKILGVEVDGELSRSADRAGARISLGRPRPVPVLLSGSGDPYSAEERIRVGGAWVAPTSPRTFDGNVYEVNNVTGLAGKVVYIRPGNSGDWLFRYVRGVEAGDGDDCDASITATLHDMCGFPLEGVLITWKDGGTTLGTATTDADGVAVFGPPIPNTFPASYTFVASGMDDYEDLEEEHGVSSCGNTSLTMGGEFTLVEKSNHNVCCLCEPAAILGDDIEMSGDESGTLSRVSSSVGPGGTWRLCIVKTSVARCVHVVDTGVSCVIQTTTSDVPLVFEWSCATGDVAFIYAPVRCGNGPPNATTQACNYDGVDCGVNTYFAAGVDCADFPWSGEDPAPPVACIPPSRWFGQERYIGTLISSSCEPFSRTYRFTLRSASCTAGLDTHITRALYHIYGVDTIDITFG